MLLLSGGGLVARSGTYLDAQFMIRILSVPLDTGVSLERHAKCVLPIEPKLLQVTFL